MTRQYLIRRIGAPLPAERMIVTDQDAWDIIDRILVKHKKCAKYYDRIADEFAGKNIEQTAYKLWNFCKLNIAYDEETIDRQEVSAPQTILKRGHSDCKGYALFIGGILDALNRQGWNIKWKYRFASDDPFNATPGHVFIVIDTPQGELWVDPVLQYFNQEHYFPFYQDKKISAPAHMAGCACDTATIGTTQQTGLAIMKIAPVLAEIPVVGWIGAAAGVVVGGLLAIFGSAYSVSSGVRKLIERYEYLVLGENVTSFNSVNEADTGAAQKWFSIVLGVPIYDIYRFYALKDVDPVHVEIQLGNSYEQRAANYFHSAPETVGKVTTAQVIQAAHIADTMQIIPPVPGRWKNMVAAPSLIDYSGAEPDLYINQNGQLTTPAGQVIPKHNNLILVAAGAAVLLLLIK